MSKNNHNKVSVHQSERVIQSESFSGPLPPPTLLKQYDEIVPGAAKIILEKFDKQTTHRIEIEKAVIRIGNIKEILGLLLGFIIAMTAILGGIYSALQGKPWFGTGVTLIGVAMIVGAFLSKGSTDNTKSSDK